MSKFVAGQQVRVTTFAAGSDYHGRIGKVLEVNPEEDYPVDVLFDNVEGSSIIEGEDCLPFGENELESADVEVGI